MPEPRISSAADPSPTPVGSQPSGISGRPASSPRWRDIQFVAFDPSTEPPPEPIAATPVETLFEATPWAAANSNERPLGSAPVSADEAVSEPEMATDDASDPEPAEAVAGELQAAAQPRLSAVEQIFAAQPRVPRYGRAIAPLPPHLIASVPPPPRTSLPPAAVTLRPSPKAAGKLAALQGIPFSAGRRGRRAVRAAVMALACATIVGIAYRGGFLTDMSARLGSFSPKAALATSAPVAPPLPSTSPLATAQPASALASAAAPAATPAEPAPPSGRVAALTAQAKAGDSGAQYDLGVVYAKGDGVAQDYAKAASWFREAAINGNAAAQYNLAVLYERGLGMPQNMNEALIWYHSAAARNYPSAQYNLAISYAEGRGTPQDMVAAARWYRRAAEQGVVAAMVNFAILCESGQGTDKSLPTAYAWYHAAAARGDEVSAKRADDLYRQFSADDRKAADAAASVVSDSIRERLLPPAAPGKSAAQQSAQTPG